MFDLPEQLTVWTPDQSDGLGGDTWFAPTTYPCRIAHNQKKFTDKNGDDSMSTSVAYTEGAATIFSVVYFGASIAASPPSDAKDVRSISQVPSGAGNMKKLWFAS